MSLVEAAAPFLGVLMLDTSFARPAGDIGHPQTFAFSVKCAVVANAHAKQTVQHVDKVDVQQFIDVGMRLVSQGACALTTSCGFLALHQTRLAQAFTVPFLSSALLQAPSVIALLRDEEKLGILTIDAPSLRQHLMVQPYLRTRCIVGSVPSNGHLANAILNGVEQLDPGVASKELVQTAAALCDAHPQIGALLLECTNMPPYAAAVARATGKPVFDVVTMLNWFWQARFPKDFA